jgi:hypothetical protein
MVWLLQFLAQALHTLVEAEEEAADLLLEELLAVLVGLVEAVLVVG